MSEDGDCTRSMHHPRCALNLRNAPLRHRPRSGTALPGKELHNQALLSQAYEFAKRRVWLTPIRPHVSAHPPSKSRLRRETRLQR